MYVEHIDTEIVGSEMKLMKHLKHEVKTVIASQTHGSINLNTPVFKQHQGAIEDAAKNINIPDVLLF